MAAVGGKDFYDTEKIYTISLFIFCTIHTTPPPVAGRYLKKNSPPHL
jgi:hypothetical protein